MNNNFTEGQARQTADMIDNMNDEQLRNAAKQAGAFNPMMANMDPNMMRQASQMMKNMSPEQMAQMQRMAAGMMGGGGMPGMAGMPGQAPPQPGFARQNTAPAGPPKKEVLPADQ